MLVKDHFTEVSTYLPHLFRRRYRMRQDLFVRIVEGCEQMEAMRVIAQGIPADYTDKYLRIGEDTMLKCVCVFAKVIIRVFGPKYLHAPNEEDTKDVDGDE